MAWSAVTVALLWPCVCSFGILRQRESLSGTDEEEALPILRNAEMQSIEDPVILRDAIAVLAKFENNLFEESLVFADRQPLHVLEHEIRGFQFDNETHEVVDKRISRVVEGTLTYHAEALAWRTTEEHVHGLVVYSGMAADIPAVDIGDASADGGTIGEIEFVRCAVDRVVFDGCGDVESSLLETEAHTARPGKEINGYGSCRVAAHQVVRILR